MPWLQLETLAGQRVPALLEERLEELGAVAVWLKDAGDEPVLEPAPGETPLWSESIVTALFTADTNAAGLTSALADLLPAEALRFSEIADKDWQSEWQSSLEPLYFGDRLCVMPDERAAPADKVVVRLPPGLAFGTGEHATTGLCLTWLTEQELKGATLLDYGCGSGLLAIAALALDASHAVAVDIDAQALAATRQNALNNDCLARLQVSPPTELSDQPQYDVLVANILSGTLIELGPTLAQLTKAGAPIALSGILAEQADSVRHAWSNWASLQTTARNGDWILLSGHKLSN